jgi:hypothetical protein
MIKMTFMIKTTIVLITVFTLLTFLGHAQDISVGGGLGYATKINNVGLNFRADVKFHKQWSITPHFNYFFNKKDGVIIEKWNALNVDGHYYFEIDQMWTIYPIFGLNFATVSEKVNDITFSNAYAGINLGIGAEYDFDRRLSGFGEIKYVISEAGQAVITLGLLYQVNH